MWGGDNTSPLKTTAWEATCSREEAGNLSFVCKGTLSSSLHRNRKSIFILADLLLDFFISTNCPRHQASVMASILPNAENQEIRILDQETPRAAPDDLVRKLLAEVSEIRKENQQLRNEVANLKTSAKRKLFQRSKESDPECSVSNCFLNSKPTIDGKYSRDERSFI